MLALRVSRDKRGYDLIYLIWDQRRRGRPEPRLLYCCRLPAPLRVGPPPFDDEVRRKLEEAYPEIPFDWAALLKSLLGVVSTAPRPVDPPHAAYRTRRAAPAPLAAPVAPTNGHRDRVPARPSSSAPIAAGRGAAGRARGSAPYSAADSLRGRHESSPSLQDGWLRTAPTHEDTGQVDHPRAQSEPVWHGLSVEVTTTLQEDTIVHLSSSTPQAIDDRRQAADGERRASRATESSDQDALVRTRTPDDAASDASDEDDGEEASAGGAAGSVSSAERTRRRRRRRRAGRSRDGATVHEGGGAAEPLVQRAQPASGGSGSDSD